MRERVFAFLNCSSCRFFAPKLKPPSNARNPVFVGLCTSGPAPEWAVWRGLERAATEAGDCDDREPREKAPPLCRLFDTTLASSPLPYPQSCIHHLSAGCLLGAP